MAGLGHCGDWKCTYLDFSPETSAVYSQHYIRVSSFSEGYSHMMAACLGVVDVVVSLVGGLREM
jgi:hypothetical protein